MKRLLLLSLFILSCKQETPKSREEQCLREEQTTIGDSFEVAYGPHKCFKVVVVCIRDVQYYLFPNSQGKGGAPAIRKNMTPYLCKDGKPIQEN